jgi:SNF2 family DNA or RNA helicase
MIAWLDSEQDVEDDALVATSPLTQSLRLMQFASAYGTIDEEDNMILAEPSCKVSAFMEDLPDFGEDSIVVFAESRKLIELLASKLDKSKIPYGLITGHVTTEDRQKNIDDFQAGKTRLILCTIKAGGTGITLTKARVMVFLQRSWSMVDQLQAEARSHRLGSEQHDSVLIVDYVTSGTIEEAQIWALSTKHARMEEIVRDKDLLLRALKGEFSGQE